MLTRWPSIAVLFVFASAQVSFAEEPAPIDFNKQVQPILAEKCIRCHGERQRGGMLDMRTLEAMLKGGVSGPAFVPGKSDKSLMIELIHFKEMPPRKDRGPRVTPDEFKLLKAWIDAASPPQP